MWIVQKGEDSLSQQRRLETSQGLNSVLAYLPVRMCQRGNSWLNRGRVLQASENSYCRKRECLLLLEKGQKRFCGQHDIESNCAQNLSSLLPYRLASVAEQRNQFVYWCIPAKLF